MASLLRLCSLENVETVRGLLQGERSMHRNAELSSLSHLWQRGVAPHRLLPTWRRRGRRGDHLRERREAVRVVDEVHKPLDAVRTALADCRDDVLTSVVDRLRGAEAAEVVLGLW